MNKLALLAAAAVTVGTFGVGAAISQDSGSTGDFGQADANKDGVVSFTEAVGVYPTLTQPLFDQADANKDGVLDNGEFTGLQGLTAGLETTLSSTSSGESSMSSSSSSGSSSASSSSAM